MVYNPFKKQEQDLVNTDKLLIAKTGLIMKDLRKVITEEVEELQLVKSAYDKVREVIPKLQAVEKLLIQAETNPNADTANLAFHKADTDLLALTAEITGVEAHVKTALGNTKIDEKLAKGAVKILNDVHKKLRVEHTRIKTAKHW